MTSSFLKLMVFFASFILFTNCKKGSSSHEATPSDLGKNCCNGLASGIFEIGQPSQFKLPPGMTNPKTIVDGNLTVYIGNGGGPLDLTAGYDLVLQKREVQKPGSLASQTLKKHSIPLFGDHQDLGSYEQIDDIFHGSKKGQYFLVVSFREFKFESIEQGDFPNHEIIELKVSDDLETIELTSINSIEEDLVHGLVDRCPEIGNRFSFNTVSISQGYLGGYYVFGNLKLEQPCSSENPLWDGAAVVSLDEQGHMSNLSQFEDFDADKFSFVAAIKSGDGFTGIVKDKNSNLTSVAKFIFNIHGSRLTFDSYFNGGKPLTLSHEGYDQIILKSLIKAGTVYLTGTAFIKGKKNESHLFMASMNERGELEPINNRSKDRFLFYRHPEVERKSIAVGEGLSLSKTTDGISIDVLGFIWEGKDIKSIWSMPIVEP